MIWFKRFSLLHAVGSANGLPTTFNHSSDGDLLWLLLVAPQYYFQKYTSAHLIFMSAMSRRYSYKSRASFTFTLPLCASAKPTSFDSLCAYALGAGDLPGISAGLCSHNAKGTEGLREG